MLPHWMPRKSRNFDFYTAGKNKMVDGRIYDVGEALAPLNKLYCYGV
jgi:hypothetical protein